jgi:hypothetical protein
VLQDVLKMATAKPEDLYPVFLDFLEKFELKKTLKAIKAEFSEQVPAAFTVAFAHATF